jgi:hypothetical protein
MLNRGVVRVRPKQPYLDWAAGLDDSGIVPNPNNDEPTVYLIPSYGDEAEAWEILATLHPAIFENELYGWHTDDAAWPNSRDFAMFKKCGPDRAREEVATGQGRSSCSST